MQWRGMFELLSPRLRMIIAGGPTREYQFVRNLLFRDTTVQSHVFLQTASTGVSQEAQKLLDNFPSTLAEMSQYDCVYCVRCGMDGS